MNESASESKQNLTSSDQPPPSPEALAQGVCHTHEECFGLYEAIPLDLREAAAESLRDGLAKEQGALERLLTAKVHLGADYLDALPHYPGSALFFGMSVRNYLRSQGFGEKELQVHNLDCVFMFILRDAVMLESHRLGRGDAR